MATVTGFTAARMLEMENATIIDGTIVGNDLILVTKDGTQVNAGNVRGPIGVTGPPGPLTQAAADVRYLRNIGDTITGTLICDPAGSAEGIRITHPSAPYISFFNASTRTGYVQGQDDQFKICAETDNPITFFTNGVEQMRLRTGTANEILTLNGNPDALIYMRAASPSGTVYNYIGKHGAWGLRATGVTGDTLLQSTGGDTRVQALYSVYMYPGNDGCAAFGPQGDVIFSESLDELEDDVPGFKWRNAWKSLRMTSNIADRTSVYLNRQGAANADGQDYISFAAGGTQIGAITNVANGIAFQAPGGDARVQATNSVDLYPGNTHNASFVPNGNVFFSKTESEDDVPGLTWRADYKSLRITCQTDGATSLYLNKQGAGGGTGQTYILFEGSGTTVGSIKRTSGGVSFNETSDYRVKDVKSPITNALERLNKLRPVRAVYHGDADQVEVDTFVAHEVSDAVPEAVSGEKDAVATEENSEMMGVPVGDPILQQLDTKKLIPLLVASVKELSAKVDELQARLAPA